MSTAIQIISERRNLTGYTEITYKMSFTLPAIFGTGANPIEGLDKIIGSYSSSGNYALEVVPVIGTVITLSETVSPDSTFLLADAKTYLQSRYATVRAVLDSLTLAALDSLAGLTWDGAAWATTASRTDMPLNIDNTQCNFGLTATGIAAAAVTLTLPAVSGKFHSIVRIEITPYSTVARTGGVTPVIVTTTNISGLPAFTFASAAAVGTTDLRGLEPVLPIKSLQANTVTTIICPGTTSVIWRINVFYNLI